MGDDERFERVRRQGGEAYAAWLAAGYRECYLANNAFRMTPFLLQKRVRDAAGVTLLFVNVYAYDWADYPLREGDPVTYEAECNFDGFDHGLPTFDVVLHGPETPEHTEWFFLKMYDAMGCRPYGDD